MSPLISSPVYKITHGRARFSRTPPQNDTLRRTAGTGTPGQVLVERATAELPEAQVAVRAPGSAWRSAPFQECASRPFNRPTILFKLLIIHNLTPTFRTVPCLSKSPLTQPLMTQPLRLSLHRGACRRSGQRWHRAGS